MGKALRIHPLVEEDLAQIVAFIQRDNPKAAITVFRAIRRNFDFLAETQGSLGAEYPLQHESLGNLKKFIVPEFRNYLIFFRNLEGEIQILYVFHGSRNIPARMKEDLRAL